MRAALVSYGQLAQLEHVSLSHRDMYPHCIRRWTFTSNVRHCVSLTRETQGSNSSEPCNWQTDTPSPLEAKPSRGLAHQSPALNAHACINYLFVATDVLLFTSQPTNE